MHLPAGVCVMSETTFLSATTAGFGAPSGSGQERSPMRAVQIFVRVVALHGGDRQRTVNLELGSLLTVKTLTGMTTDVYPRENCIAPAIVLIVWTTNTKK